MSGHIPLIILCIVLGLIVLELLLFTVISPLYKYLRRRGSRVRTVRARVLLAESRDSALLPWWIRIPVARRRRRIWILPDECEDWGNQYTYWITFEVGDSNLEFEVSEDEFSEFSPNDFGELSYQADKVLSFSKIGSRR